MVISSFTMESIIPAVVIPSTFYGCHYVLLCKAISSVPGVLQRTSSATLGPRGMGEPHVAALRRNSAAPATHQTAPTHPPSALHPCPFTDQQGCPEFRPREIPASRATRLMPLHARPYPCPGYGVPSAQRSAVLRTGPYRTTRTQCVRASGHHGLGTAKSGACVRLVVF